MRKYLPLAITLLAGCAVAPDKILPGWYVASVNYATMDCDTIRNEIALRYEAISGLAMKQSKSRSIDSILVGVGTFLVWPAFFGLLATDDYAEQISSLRGEGVALLQEHMSKCPPEPPIPAIFTRTIQPPIR